MLQDFLFLDILTCLGSVLPLFCGTASVTVVDESSSAVLVSSHTTLPKLCVSIISTGSALERDMSVLYELQDWDEHRSRRRLFKTKQGKCCGCSSKQPSY